MSSSSATKVPQCVFTRALKCSHSDCYDLENSLDSGDVNVNRINN